MIGAIDHRAEVFLLLQRGKSDTDRRPGYGFRQDLADGGEPPFRFSETDVGQSADELIAAVAHHDVVRTQAMPKCGTDLPEQQVTDDMSLLVIALLQMVDVDEGENQWPAGCNT